MLLGVELIHWFNSNSSEFCEMENAKSSKRDAEQKSSLSLSVSVLCLVPLKYLMWSKSIQTLCCSK